MNKDVLSALETVLEQRKDAANPNESYVAQLHHKGLNKILEKVGEEATEAILAAKDTEAGQQPDALVGEVADLWFHSMVMLSHLDIEVDQVLQCLADRFDVSGIDEKASRGA